MPPARERSLPSDYDAIQPPRFDENINIVSPEMFSEVNGIVQIEVTTAGNDFTSDRVLAGLGLNHRSGSRSGKEISLFPGTYSPRGTQVA